jgi:DNA (cytosine-5)-methyltransferase 1
MVDLFAGCGGLSLGMEQAGFVPVFVNELNADAMATYLANRKHRFNGRPFEEHAELHCADANELVGERLDKLVSDLEALQGLGLNFEGEHGSTLDLIAGGPPCQGYSGLGHRRSYSVDKKELPSNQLYQRMASVIAHLRPRIFLFENVRGLLTSRWERNENRRIWPDVLQEFRVIPGYEVRWSLVRSSHYGVPQNRPRILLVGIRTDICQKSLIADPTKHPDDAVTCSFLPQGDASDCPDLIDLLGDLVDPRIGHILTHGSPAREEFVTADYPKPPQNELQASLRRTPAGLPTRLTEQVYSRHSPRIVSKFLYMQENGGELPPWGRTKKFSQRLLPARWHNRQPTVTATSMPDDYVHFAQPRTLTVREWARLQLFPDWYEFRGKRTTGGIRRAGNPLEGIFEREVPKYTQIGNAVPVKLAKHVGDHFRTILRGAGLPESEHREQSVAEQV